MRRWSLAYSTSTITTAAGTASYAIPGTILAMSHVYYLTDSGSPVELENYDAQELRRIYGEGANSIQGPPRGFAVEGANLQLFPVPDTNAGSNYTIVVEGYRNLLQIVETTGTTVAASATLTVPSSAYLTARGLSTTGSYLSVRSAGNLGPSSVADTHFTNWTAFPAATTVTMSTPAITVATATQVFFNSWNWLIEAFDLVVLFGVLREVAAYEKENFGVWQQRLDAALDEMAQYDADRRKTLISMGTAVTGQRQAQLAMLDSKLWWGGPSNVAWW